MHINTLIAAITLATSIALPASAQVETGAETERKAILAVVARWYELQDDPLDCQPYELMAPMAVSDGNWRPYRDPLAPQSAAADFSCANRQMSARALQFAYDIDRIRIESHLARVDVWERGYFYATAAQKTYENAADAMFVFEKQTDGRWLILAHSATTQGIPPTRITNPLPDLRDLYYSTEGAGRDAEADAKAATVF